MLTYAHMMIILFWLTAYNNDLMHDFPSLLSWV